MAVAKDNLSYDEALSRLSYDSNTGVITRKTAPNNRCKAGLEAGYIDTQGYRVIVINYQNYKAHRLAWLLHYGAWPQTSIDHINGCKSDNRIENLRSCSHAENSRNRRCNGSRNKTGTLGVSYRPKKNKTNPWYAHIGFLGKRIDLGYYASFDDAKRARKVAEKNLFGRFAPIWLEN